MTFVSKDVVEALNTGAERAAGWIVEVVSEKSLRLTLIKQIEVQERKVMDEMAKLLQKYEHAHRLAIANRPNHELDAILLVRGIGKEKPQ